MLDTMDINRSESLKHSFRFCGRIFSREISPKIEESLEGIRQDITITSLILEVDDILQERKSLISIDKSVIYEGEITIEVTAIATGESCDIYPALLILKEFYSQIRAKPPISGLAPAHTWITGQWGAY